MSATLFKKLFWQTAVSAFLSFLTFAFGFLRVYYFSKSLSMEEFGILSLLLTLSAFLLYLFTLGSFQFLFKSAHEGIAERKAAFWASVLITTGISLVSTILTFLFVDPISAVLGLSDFKAELKLTVIATATTSIMTVFLYYHYGLGRNNFQNFLQFLRSSLWVVIAIGLTFFFDLSLYQILLVVNLSMCLILLLSVPWAELDSLFSIEPGNITFYKLFKYCIPLLPYFAGVWGIPMIIRTQLNIYDGAKNVAIFSVAYTLMEIVFMFISTITATLSPYFFSESSTDKRPGLFFSVMLKYSVLSILFIVPFIFILRYDILLLVASEKYRVAGDYIPLLIFFPLLRVLVIVFEQQYLKASKTIYLGMVYVMGMLFSFLLAVFLIPKYSIYGAINSSLLAYTLIFICLFVKQKTVVEFAYLKLFWIMVFVVIVWITVFVLGYFDFSNWYKILPLAVISVGALFALPVFGSNEKEKVFNFLKGKP